MLASNFPKRGNIKTITITKPNQNRWPAPQVQTRFSETCEMCKYNIKKRERVNIIKNGEKRGQSFRRLATTSTGAAAKQKQRVIQQGI